MIIPMQCFTCGKPISNLEEDYKKLVLKYSNAESLESNTNFVKMDEDILKQNTPQCRALDELNIKRYCCRSLFLTYTEPIEHF